MGWRSWLLGGEGRETGSEERGATRPANDPRLVLGERVRTNGSNRVLPAKGKVTESCPSSVWHIVTFRPSRQGCPPSLRRPSRRTAGSISTPCELAGSTSARCGRSSSRPANTSARHTGSPPIRSGSGAPDSPPSVFPAVPRLSSRPTGSSPRTTTAPISPSVAATWWWTFGRSAKPSTTYTTRILSCWSCRRGGCTRLKRGPTRPRVEARLERDLLDWNS